MMIGGLARSAMGHRLTSAPQIADVRSAPAPVRDFRPPRAGSSFGPSALESDLPFSQRGRLRPERYRSEKATSIPRKTGFSMYLSKDLLPEIMSASTVIPGWRRA